MSHGLVPPFSYLITKWDSINLLLYRTSSIKPVVWRSLTAKTVWVSFSYLDIDKDICGQEVAFLSEALGLVLIMVESDREFIFERIL